MPEIFNQKWKRVERKLLKLSSNFSVKNFLQVVDKHTKFPVNLFQFKRNLPRLFPIKFFLFLDFSENVCRRKKKPWLYGWIRICCFPSQPISVHIMFHLKIYQNSLNFSKKFRTLVALFCIISCEIVFVWVWDFNLASSEYFFSHETLILLLCLHNEMFEPWSKRERRRS